MSEHTQRRLQWGPVTVRPDDPRYGDLARRGSRRFTGKPDYVQLVGSTGQVVEGCARRGAGAVTGCGA